MHPLWRALLFFKSLISPMEQKEQQPKYVKVIKIFAFYVFPLLIIALTTALLVLPTRQ